MATLTNTKIKDTYVGLLKTTDNQAIDASGVTLVEDGAGNASALSVGRSGNGVSISGNLAVDTNTLYVDAANDNIGIGVSNPVSSLHIKDSRFQKLTLTNDDFVNGTTGASFDVTFGAVSGNTYTEIRSLKDGRTDWADFVLARAGGNIGIGTATPAQKLDVNGSIRTNSTFQFYDTGGSAYSQGAFDASLYKFIVSGSEKARIDSSGRLLINATTTSFSDPLYVNGNAYSAGGWRVGTATTYIGQIRNAAGKLSIESDTNRDIQFTDVDGDVVMYIDTSAESVGIGTSSPSAKIDINGGARLRNDNALQWHNGFGLVTGEILGSGGGHLNFSTGGSERMRIDSSGNVGINSTPQNFRLDVNGHYNASTGTAGTDGTGDVYRSGIGWGSTAQPTNVLSSLITTINDGNYGGHITLSNRPSGGGNLVERMRITSGGDLLIGKIVTTFTTDGARLSSTGGNISRTSGTVFDINRNGTDGNVVAFYKAGVNVGTISVTGSSTAYNTSSDYRLKENVVEMTGALDRVDALKPSRFNFIAEPNKTVDGFLAHEVQAIVPEAVTGEKDAVDEEGNPIYQGIDQSKLVPLLVGAIKELRAEIELLKAK